MAVKELCNIQFIYCNPVWFLICYGILLCRSCRGRHVSLIVRFPAHGRQGEEYEVWSHSNESVAAVRRQILNR